MTDGQWMVWDSNGVPLSNNPLHKGDPRNPNHRAPNHQLTITWTQRCFKRRNCWCVWLAPSHVVQIHIQLFECFSSTYVMISPQFSTTRKLDWFLPLSFIQLLILRSDALSDFMNATNMKRSSQPSSHSDDDDFPPPSYSDSYGRTLIHSEKRYLFACSHLGGGFRYFLFSPLFGEDSQFD